MISSRKKNTLCKKGKMITFQVFHFEYLVIITQLLNIYPNFDITVSKRGRIGKSVCVGGQGWGWGERKLNSHPLQGEVN